MIFISMKDLLKSLIIVNIILWTFAIFVLSTASFVFKFTPLANVAVGYGLAIYSMYIANLFYLYCRRKK